MLILGLVAIAILSAQVDSMAAVKDLLADKSMRSEGMASLTASTSGLEEYRDDDALAVIYVAENVSDEQGFNATALACSLQSVNRNIATYSPTHMYIWTRSKPQDVPTWLTSYPNVTVLFIPDESWKLPEGYGSQSQWLLGQHTDPSAYLTSRWRLNHAFDFARAQGHRYLLHIDPHAVVMEAFNVNMVATLDLHQRHVGYRNRVLQEDATVASGLMELARFWMAIRNMDTPAGTLFSAVKAADMSGLTSRAWNRHVLPSSFLIVSVEFWFRSEVQDFLNLVLRTGCDLTQRWLDRGVFNIIVLLFLPDSSIVRFPSTAVLDQRLQRTGDYQTILQCPAIPKNDNLPRIEDSNDRAGEERDIGPDHEGPRSIVFLVSWEPSVILVVQGVQPIEEVVVFRWYYNISSYGRDTGALNNYTGILHGLMARPVNVDWWETHNIPHKLERLRAKPVLPDDPTSLDGEETLEIFQDQLDAYVDFFCADSAFVQAGAQLPRYCDMIRRQAHSFLTTQTTALLREAEGGTLNIP